MSPTHVDDSLISLYHKIRQIVYISLQNSPKERSLTQTSRSVLFYYILKTQKRATCSHPQRNAVMSRKLVAPILTELYKRKTSATYSGANLTTVSVCGGMCRARSFNHSMRAASFHSNARDVYSG